MIKKITQKGNEVIITFKEEEDAHNYYKAMRPCFKIINNMEETNEMKMFKKPIKISG